MAVNKQGDVTAIEVRLDHAPEHTVVFDPKQYRHFTHGYAATVAKLQGQTRKHSFTYINGAGWNRHAGYVAQSRHTASSQLFVNQESCADLTALKNTLKRAAMKDSVLDWPWLFRERRGLAPDNRVTVRFQQHLAVRLKTLHNQMTDAWEEWILPQRYWDRKKTEAAQLAAEESILLRRQAAVTVAHYVDARRAAGAVWQQVLKENKKLIEEKANAKENAAKHTPAKNTLQKKEEPYPIQFTNPALYKEAQAAFAQRDALASAIMQQPEQFQRALSHYALSLETVTQQTHIHAGRERVKHYHEERLSNRTVHRDRLAAAIMQDVKQHGAGVSFYNEDWRGIRQHALDHERRVLISRLNPTERERFYKVEKYIENYWEAARLWRLFFDAKTKGVALDPDIVAMAKEASATRNQLAGEIYRTIHDYQTGLHFYHIELEAGAHSIYAGYAPDQKNNAVDIFAKRHVKLKKYAEQQYAKERVETYFSSDDLSLREKAADKNRKIQPFSLPLSRRAYRRRQSKIKNLAVSNY